VFLDEHEPGWVDEIDVAQLDLNSCDVCVLGQLFGQYGKAVTTLGFSLDDETRLGFNVTYDMLARAADGDESPKDVAFAELTAAWREEIARRRLARVAAPQQEEAVPA
jgi:hypothetical protein